jgi:hypothetical protein
VLQGAPVGVTAGPVLGTDLLGAVSWMGQPVVVTSDRSGGPVQVQIERRLADNSTVWWPVPMPDMAGMPHRGCGVFLDGEQLHLLGGVNAAGETLNNHWVLDLQALRTSGFLKPAWKSATPLPEKSAWMASVMTDRDAFSTGGVQGYFLQRGKDKDGNGIDVQSLARTRHTQVGGLQANWRERAAPPSDTTGSHAITVGNVVVTGPGNRRDGAVSCYDLNEKAWFALPQLPTSVGCGQLHSDGTQLLYTGGFLQNGAATDAIYALDLNDPYANWRAIGNNEAVAGNARVVDRAGKQVSLIVTPNGSAMAHLERA